ncbi:MAG: hypothetical protein E7616_07780 [Ruminococcaceae bacterium]|nr:hypothetical protein [Oscillospiraceae bacterium]
MKETVQHEKIGQIVYEESFWSGKKELTIDGVKLVKQQKNTFVWNCGGQNKLVYVKGSFATSAKLYVDDTVVELTPSAKWYELVCSILIFVLIMVWGNSVTLCSILPVVGGAIGGGISGAMAFLNLIMMKAQKKVGVKLGIWVAMLAATFITCFLVAIALLLAL